MKISVIATKDETSLEELCVGDIFQPIENDEMLDNNDFYMKTDSCNGSDQTLIAIVELRQGTLLWVPQTIRVTLVPDATLEIRFPQ